MSSTLERLQLWGLVILIFLVPVFFLPTTVDFFDFNKMILLVVGTALLLILWAIRKVLENRMIVSIAPFDIGVFAVAIVFLLSAILRSPNKMDAFLIPGAATIILGASALYFVITQTIAGKATNARMALWALLLSGLVVALVSIASSLGIWEKLPSIPPFAKVLTFSLIGAPLPTAMFLGTLILMVIGKVITTGKREKLVAMYYSALGAIFVVAIVAVAIHMTPGKIAQPQLLPVSSGWAIAVDTLKTSPLGVGPGNFITAFNASRPLDYNQTDLWNIRFSTSSNWYFQLFTEVGIVGLIVFLFLVWQIVRTISLHKETLAFQAKETLAFQAKETLAFQAKDYVWFTYLLLVILAALFIVPGNFIILFALYTFLGLAGGLLTREVKVGGDRVLPILTAVVFAGFALWLGAFGTQAYAAEVTYKEAIGAAARNDGKLLYDLLVRAVNQNPRVERYRIALSQDDLLIARSIAQKGNENITDQDRESITQLVQQAIREARVAVALNNRLSTNWENLAAIYRAIIPFAAGADAWAVTSYTQAIALEPTNPFIRINLGGVHFAAGRYDEAVKQFEFAIAAKFDLANAHYNLSAALREKGDITRAIQEMEKTLSLVQPNTNDYEIAQSELENLKSKLPAAAARSKTPTAGPSETLQAPEPGSSQPVLKPPLELSQEAAPPSPSPSPQP